MVYTGLGMGLRTRISGVARLAASQQVGRSRRVVALAMISCALMLNGCSSSDSDDPNTGYFIDSAVEGVFYTTPSFSGTTDVNGTFTYMPGEEVSFYIGDILLGTAVGQDILTPIEFVPGAVDTSNPEVVNILRFIQSLDEDGNPDNGISITAFSVDQAVGQSLDFSLSTGDFENAADALLVVLTSGTVTSLIDASDAIDHFNGSNGGGSSSPNLALSGADTALFGTSFSYDPVLTTVTDLGLGLQSITWQQPMANSSLLEVGVIILGTDIQSVSLAWSNGSGSGPANATYGISCPGNIAPLFPAGDCSQMGLDTVNGDVTFDVSIGPYEIVPPNGATAAISASGLLEY
ncbi:MAG: hypothetical protein QNJ85_09870 [Gammaproteobacteria bacterium]|nr:hypothetical protein [Gammaproteobacteria bacterium]